MLKLLCLILIVPVKANAAQTVEHQIRICDSVSHIQRQIPKSVQVRKFKTFYIENAQRDFTRSGFSLRVRLKNNSAEVTIKKRFSQEPDLSKNKKEICEYDLHGGQIEFSCKINADISKELFNDVLSRKKEWSSILSFDQIAFIKKYKGSLDHAVVFGTLNNRRYQWNDERLGEVTLDIVSQENHEENTFHEISVRYDLEDRSKEIQFNRFFNTLGMKACENQIDWSVNKFDVLNIL